MNPDSGRVLLRWHQRHQSWLLVGGHADPDEQDPLAITLREGREETGCVTLRLGRTQSYDNRNRLKPCPRCGTSPGLRDPTRAHRGRAAARPADQR
ncbi:NUDIX domain-containing protein [Streptomyces canus]|uniref:NUDIX domain-containing protein n=1 Tax=Streptomyces canus TaxID=58343 RepID=UPI0033A1E430